jgi:hypothetical protein
MASARTWNVASTATLYARWTANTYTVTLNGNGGSGGTASVTATYDNAMPTATAPSRGGYTFSGYYDTSASSGGTQYYTYAMGSARTWNKTSTATLYARWTPNAYTVIFNGNGATSGSTQPQDVVYGQSFNLSSNGFTRDGHKFKGWAKTSTGSVVYTNYQRVSNLTTDEFIDLWAVWESIFKYNFQAVDGGYYSIDGFADGITNIKALTGANKIPSSYNGFSVMMIGPSAFANKGLTSVTIPNGIKYIEASAFENNSLTALDIPNSVEYIGSSAFSKNYGVKSITVGTGIRRIYDYAFAYFGGGSGEYPSNIITARFMGTTPPTYVGSDVFGSTSPYWLSSLNALIVPSSSYVNAFKSAFSQYQTKVVPYGSTTVTFNKQSGTGGTNSVYVAIGASMPSATAPTRTSYLFKGYYDQTSGGVQYYTETMIGTRPWDKAGTSGTLYARWEFSQVPEWTDTSYTGYYWEGELGQITMLSRNVAGGSGTITVDIAVTSDASAHEEFNVGYQVSGTTVTFYLMGGVYKGGGGREYLMTVYRGGIKGNSFFLYVVT